MTVPVWGRPSVSSAVQWGGKSNVHGARMVGWPWRHGQLRHVERGCCFVRVADAVQGLASIQSILDYLSSYCLASVWRAPFWLSASWMVNLLIFLEPKLIFFADSCHAQLCFWGAGLLKRRMPCTKGQTVNSASEVISKVMGSDLIWHATTWFDVLLHDMTRYHDIGWFHLP